MTKLELLAFWVGTWGGRSSRELAAENLLDAPSGVCSKKIGGADWGGGTAMKRARVDRLQLCCGVQGTPQETGGQQKTGSRKFAAGFWGAVVGESKIGIKSAEGSAGGGVVCRLRATTWQQKIRGGGTPIRGAGGGAAATVLQGTGCRVHHRKLGRSNKLAAEYLLQAFRGGCVW